MSCKEPNFGDTNVKMYPKFLVLGKTEPKEERKAVMG